MNIKCIAAAWAGALVSAGAAFGHGVQVQITFNPTSGRIETREVVSSEFRPTAVSDHTRVYVMPLRSLAGGAGDGWYTRPDETLNAFGLPAYPTGPGLNFQYDEAGQLPGTGWAFSGSSTLPNLQGTNFRVDFAGGLQSWNGSGFADPGDEQLQMFRGDGTAIPTLTATTSDGGPLTGLNMSTISSKSSNPHSSMGYRLLGDGSSSGLTGSAAGDAGVYLASFVVSSTAAGVGASEPIYFVMFKQTGLATALEAANSLGFSPSQVQVVPEPATIALVALAAAAFARRRS